MTKSSTWISLGKLARFLPALPIIILAALFAGFTQFFISLCFIYFRAVHLDEMEDYTYKWLRCIENAHKHDLK